MKKFNVVIDEGRFSGGELEPGTFHGHASSSTCVFAFPEDGGNDSPDKEGGEPDMPADSEEYKEVLYP